MTNLQHFFTARLLHDQPSTFLNNKATTEPTSRNSEQQKYYMTKLKFLNNYYMTNLQHFLTTKLLHDQPSTFLNNKTTTWPNFNISIQQDFYMKPSTFLKETTTWPTFNISLQQVYYMSNLQHFYTARLLHDQPSTFLNETTTWPTFNIS